MANLNYQLKQLRRIISIEYNHNYDVIYLTETLHESNQFFSQMCQCVNRALLGPGVELMKPPPPKILDLYLLLF